MNWRQHRRAFFLKQRTERDKNKSWWLILQWYICLIYQGRHVSRTYIYLRKLSCRASLRHKFFRNESIFVMGILPYKPGIKNFLFTYHKPESIYVSFKFKTTRCFSAVSTTVVSCHYGNSITLNSQLLPHILHFLRC